MFNKILFEYDRIKVVANDQGWVRAINKAATNGASILAVSNDKKILLVKEKRIFVKKGEEHELKKVWNIPRGAGELDELSIEVAKREFNEETGICHPINDIKLLGYIYPDNGFLINKIPIFLIENCSTETKILDSNEINNISFFSISEIYKMIANKELEDAFTLSAITLYQAYLHN